MLVNYCPIDTSFLSTVILIEYFITEPVLDITGTLENVITVSKDE